MRMSIGGEDKRIKDRSPRHYNITSLRGRGRAKESRLTSFSVSKGAQSVREKVKKNYQEGEGAQLHQMLLLI